MYGTTTLGPAITIAPEKVLAVLVWVMFALWLIYTLIATYHWLRYGAGSTMAIPALATHVIVSLAIALFAVSGLN